MNTEFKINVILGSGREILFDGIRYGTRYKAERDGVRITIGEDFPARVTIIPPTPQEAISSIEYSVYTDIKNYHEQIVPDTGRSYSDIMSMSRFFRYKDESSINNVRMPLYIFTGQDHYMSLAFGVIGENYETSFRALEPEVRRALIVYMRRLSMMIKRGTEQYPIPTSLSKRNPDGSITEYIFFRTAADVPRQPWLLTLREFAALQKKIYSLPDVTTSRSLYPLWCSWTDWFSDDVTEEVIINNAREGVKLGIRNYIIDDGWFGPGLDNDFDVTINMGDWEPDPAKIRDMGRLVREIKKVGASPMIWCAPHAVAPAAKCFPQREPYLIMGQDGELLLTHNGFHVLCFMNPDAREIMADICADFIRKWDFDGAKYDLFNCVANIKCSNPNHHHDVSSMIEGLEKTLALINEKTAALKKDYIVELKQNYGTPFLAKYGTMMRAGDTPYNAEGNFKRTLYNQSYTPYSANDYQTITNDDTPEDAACIVLKMMAVGIPTYSIDFFRLNQKNKAVIANYNHWYNEHIALFHSYRIPLDPDNNVFKIADQERDIFFLVNNGDKLELERGATILNGTYNCNIFLRSPENMRVEITQFDCYGQVTGQDEAAFIADEWRSLTVAPGGRVEVDII